MHVEHVVPNVKESPIRINQIARIQSNSYCELHCHKEIEFLMVRDGSFCCIIDEKNIMLSSGDTIMINRDVPHATRGVKGTSMGMVQINVENIMLQNEKIEYLSLFLNENKFKFYVFKHKMEATEELDNLLKSIFLEYRDKRQAHELFIKGNAINVIGLLFRFNILDDYFSEITKDSLTKILPILTYIEKNYMNSVTLKNICDEIHLNGSYACRLFKRITTHTIFEYLSFIRVYKSQILLRTTDLSITDIALDVGFSSLSYYNRCFFKSCKCAPTLYRKISTQADNSYMA